jgi:hypothetical protein
MRLTMVVCWRVGGRRLEQRPGLPAVGASEPRSPGDGALILELTWPLPRNPVHSHVRPAGPTGRDQILGRRHRLLLSRSTSRRVWGDPAAFLTALRNPVAHATTPALTRLDRKRCIHPDLNRHSYCNGPRGLLAGSSKPTGWPRVRKGMTITPTFRMEPNQ